MWPCIPSTSSVSTDFIGGVAARSSNFSAAQPSLLADGSLSRNQGGSRIAVLRIPQPFRGFSGAQPSWLVDVLRGCLELLMRG
jgi:hypothetical protein